MLYASDKKTGGSESFFKIERGFLNIRNVILPQEKLLLPLTAPELENTSKNVAGHAGNQIEK